MTIDLAALEAMLANATPGPWTIDTLHWIDRAHADRALIVAAVNALPGLLAIVRAADAMREWCDPISEPHRQVRIAYDAARAKVKP